MVLTRILNIVILYYKLGNYLCKFPYKINKIYILNLYNVFRSMMIINITKGSIDAVRTI